MSKVDLELKKAFTELQEKQIETAQKLRISDIQIETLKRTKQHAQFTEREISALGEGTRTYETVGRMFVLTPIEQVKEGLKKKQTWSDDKIKVLLNNKTYLENSLKDATNSLRELAIARLQHKQNYAVKGLELIKSQLSSISKYKSYADGVLSELSALEMNSKVYASVGRMFIEVPLNEVVDSINKEETKYQNEINVLVQTKLYFRELMKKINHYLLQMLKIKNNRLL